MTDDARRPRLDFLSSDPARRDAAIAREEALLSEWPAADDRRVDLQRGLALWKIGEALFRSGQMEEAAERLSEAERALSRVPGLERALAGALSARAGALLVLGRHGEARMIAARVVQLATELDINEYLLTGWSARAFASKALGDWPEASFAADGLLESLKADDEVSKRGSLVARAVLIKATAARMAGQTQRGLRLVERVIDRTRRDKDHEVLCEALGERAELLYAAGRTTAAIQAYEEVIAAYDDSSEDFARQAVIVARGRRMRMRAVSGVSRLNPLQTRHRE